MADKARKKLGDLGERMALAHLTELGYGLVETNWHCEIGELDIVAWHGQCLCFIEVRTRRGNGAGTPEDSVSLVKQRRLQNLAEAYLQAHENLFLPGGEAPPCRIDLVAIQFDPSGRLMRLQVYPNAVEAE